MSEFYLNLVGNIQRITILNFPPQHYTWFTFSERRMSAKREKEDIPRLLTTENIRVIKAKEMYQNDITNSASQ